MERTLLKTETTQWFEETDGDGIRRLRMEKEIKKYFPDDLDGDGQLLTRHNPVKSYIVENY
jgi:hypothetical protein|tara:strand:- start:4056 stop:4238 length:183 start_codon:yes stop_codon:yes gene_type:complete